MMTNAERAKQFMAFSPLKGLDKALLAQEQPREGRVYLGEDAQQDLNAKLQSLEPGDCVTAEYYRGGRYVRTSGTVTKIDMTVRRLILGEVRIPLDDLKNIEREDI